MTEDKRIQSVSRAVNILKAIGNKSDGMSLSEIAKQVYLPRSTVQRIIAALELEGFIRSEGAGKILLGSGIFKLISSCYTDIVSLTQNSLKKLSERVQETVVISQAYNSDLLILHRFIVNRELQVVPRVGTLVPIYRAAAGRALLALCTDDEIIELLGDKVVKEMGLLKRIAAIRVAGIDVDYSDIVRGIVTIGVSVDSFLGKFGITILAPQHRYDQNKDFYVKELLKLKEQIIAEIGTE